MSSSVEHKQEHSGGGRHEPPSEEQRQKWNSEFKQNFLDQYHKQYNDTTISAEQTWELYLFADELWHTKMKEHRHERHHQHQAHPPSDHNPPAPHHSPPPSQFEETRKRINSELHQELLNDFKATHASTDKVDAQQAWQLAEKVQHSKHDKLEADRAKHGHKHGPKDHGRHSPPQDHRS